MMTAPSAISDLLRFEELASGDQRVDALFRAKFACAPPQVPHHLGVLIDGLGHEARLASYVHFRRHGAVILVGGACTDGQVIRQMPAAAQRRIVTAGGIYLAALRHWFAQFDNGCEAFFGYCGDRRAYEVDIAAGFRDTGRQYLIVKFNPALGDPDQARLIDQVAAIGPF